MFLLFDDWMKNGTCCAVAGWRARNTPVERVSKGAHARNGKTHANGSDGPGCSREDLHIKANYWFGLVWLIGVNSNSIVMTTFGQDDVDEIVAANLKKLDGEISEIVNIEHQRVKFVDQIAWSVGMI